jgi:hypothetical protein
MTAHPFKNYDTLLLLLAFSPGRAKKARQRVRAFAKALLACGSMVLILLL